MGIEVTKITLTEGLSVGDTITLIDGSTQHVITKIEPNSATLSGPISKLEQAIREAINEEESE